MKNNVFEILNDKIDYNNEYKKLQKLLLTVQYSPDPYYGTYLPVQLAETFNNNIHDFKYRGTYLSLEEMINKLKNVFSSNVVLKTLYLCELILNVIDFTDSIVKNHSRSEQMLQLIDNVNIILDKSGYIAKYNKKENRIMVVCKNADTFEAINSTSDKDIQYLLLQYIDLRTTNDVITKKAILTDFGQYLEPKRDDLSEINKDLADTIFFGLNNFHLRHNNKEGKDKKEYIINMEKEDLIKWYDRLYSLILIAIRLLEMKNKLSEFDVLKKQSKSN